jgi:trk system potassium uptake protein TrkA
MRILIIGAGDIGFNLSRRLAREKADIAIVESNAPRAQRAREQMDALVVEGHGASIVALRKAGVERADLVAALTDNDEVNILACQLAKKAGVKTTIARVKNPEYALPEYTLTARDLGVDHFIHPEKETADTIVRLIRQASATDIIEFENGKIQLVGVRLEVDSPLLRTPLSRLVERFGNPPPSTRTRSTGDTIAPRLVRVSLIRVSFSS